VTRSVFAAAKLQTRGKECVTLFCRAIEKTPS
jgi:hypothetical protein